MKHRIVDIKPTFHDRRLQCVPHPGVIIFTVILLYMDIISYLIATRHTLRLGAAMPSPSTLLAIQRGVERIRMWHVAK